MSSMASPPLPVIFIILSIFPFTVLPVAQAIPFVVFHGFNDNCSQEVMQFTDLLGQWSGSKGYCIEIGNGKYDSMLMPLMQQVAVACDKVLRMPELSQGYNIVGLSQGNMIGRGIIEFCDAGPPVRNYISLAGPHAGVSTIPNCTGLLCKIVRNPIIRSEIYTGAFQQHFAPSNYVKIPDDIAEYLKACKFLPKLNNEIVSERISLYKNRFTSLRNLVLIMFESDTTLVPKETSWFGYYPEGATHPVLPPKKTKLYTEDWIGLKTLDEAGKVKFVSVKGGHLKISQGDMQQYIVPYLKNKHQSN